jgi:hypothetical protein
LNFRNLLCVCFQLGWGDGGGGRGEGGEEGVQKGVNTVNFRIYLVFDSAHSFALHFFTKKNTKYSRNFGRNCGTQQS